jgi:tRNA G18 (ribose-2'-O)-methylase SpoU
MSGGRTPTPTPLGRSSPRLRALRALVRHGDGARAVADGFKLVIDLARRGVEIEAVYATPDRLDALQAEPALEGVGRRGALYRVEEPVMEAIAPTRHPQGVLATLPIPGHRLPPPAAGTLVYLDRVQDPVNVGAVVRCAAALSAAAVACSPGCGSPFSARAVRASAGQSLLFPVATEVELPALAGAFVAAGGGVVGAVSRDAPPLDPGRLHRPILLVLGNEGSGLSPEVEPLCSARVTIPLSGGVESLNVAVSAGILLAALGGLVPSPILDS